MVETPEDVDNLVVSDPASLAFVSQTTLSVDDTREVIGKLQERFPHISAPRKNDICYATQNRQDAVKDLCSRSDLLLVVGASNSSNSNRLRELGERAGIPSYLIATADDIDENWLTVQRIGVTAGASAPEELVQQVVSRIKGSPSTVVTELAGREENITFSVPKELRREA